MQAPTIQIKRLPMQAAHWLRIIFAKPRSEGQLPLVILRKHGIEARGIKVLRYSRVCSFTGRRTHVPITFPHTMAFGLQMELFLWRTFPYNVLGMVHLNNTITQYRRIPVGAKLDMEVQFEPDLKPFYNGYIITMITRAYMGGTLVWEERSENLKLTKERVPGIARPRNPEPIEGGIQQHWRIGTWKGVSYAIRAGSGDVNPIHLHPFFSRRFGFKQHVVQGMYTKARALAHLEHIIGDRPHRCSVDFKIPVYLPNVVTFVYKEDEQGIDFQLRDRQNRRPHLVGRVDYL